jgi:hypothetical protein
MWRSCAALAFAVALAAPPARHAAAAATKQQIESLLKAFEANGEKWLKGEPIDPAVERELKAITFDAPSAEPLKTVLRSMKCKSTAELYALNRLLRQVLLAKSEVVRVVLPAVKTIHARTRTMYRRFPPYSAGGKQGDVLPPPSRRALETDAIMRSMAAVDLRRQAKVARDKPIARHNEVIFGIEEKTYQMMLRADDSREDRQLVAAMVSAERRRNALFLTISDLIGAEARKMSKERAQALYASLKTYARQLRMVDQREYLHFGSADIDPDGPTTCVKKKVYPGIQLYTVLSRIATAARMPALKAPSAKEIQELHKKRR